MKLSTLMVLFATAFVSLSAKADVEMIDKSVDPSDEASQLAKKYEARMAHMDQTYTVDLSSNGERKPTSAAALKNDPLKMALIKKTKRASQNPSSVRANSTND